MCARCVEEQAQINAVNDSENSYPSCPGSILNREVDDVPTPAEWKEGLPAELDLSSAETRLTRREMNALKRMLKRCSRVWRRPDEKLGADVPFRYHLETETEKPINQGPRRLHPTRLMQAQTEVDRMRELDVIEPSRSPWASPIVLRRRMAVLGSAWTTEN